MGALTTVLVSPPAASAGRGSVAVSALRCRQWVKNLLVVIAPAGAGVLLQPHVALATFAAFVALSAVSSAAYLVNDVVDADLDRANPRKRHRPVASGALRPTTALAAAAGLGVGALTLACVVRPELGAVVCVYAVLTLAYSWRLKHLLGLELVVLSAGFLLRAVAGGAATGVPLSPWFLVVAVTGSLFMAAGKRASELRDYADLLTPIGLGHRLARYTRRTLQTVWTVAAVATVITYVLWSWLVDASTSSRPFAVASVVPFVVALARYARVVARGAAQEPEVVVLHDRVLLLAGAGWAVLFALGALTA